MTLDSDKEKLQKIQASKIFILTKQMFVYGHLLVQI